MLRKCVSHTVACARRYAMNVSGISTRQVRQCYNAVTRECCFTGMCVCAGVAVFSASRVVCKRILNAKVRV